MLVAFTNYLRLLFIPYPLTVNHQIYPGFTALFYHDFNPAVLPTPPSFHEPQLWLSTAVILALIIMIYRAKSRFPLLSFSLTWMVLPLLPEMVDHHPFMDVKIALVSLFFGTRVDRGRNVIRIIKTRVVIASVAYPATTVQLGNNEIF